MKSISAVFIFAFCLIGSAYAAGLAEKEVDPNSAPAIYARSQIYTAEGANLAYRALAHQGWSEWADHEHMIPAARKAKLDEVDSITLRRVTGVSYRNGYIEALAKDGVDK